MAKKITFATQARCIAANSPEWAVAQVVTAKINLIITCTTVSGVVFAKAHKLFFNVNN